MFIEHLAFQHPDPVAAANWYQQHLGFSIVRSSDGPAHARFLADGAGKTVLEIYNNPSAPMPDYPALSPLVLHVALFSTNPEIDTTRLINAGATLIDAPVKTPSGDTLAMLRDPWGIPLQIAHRAKPLIV
ncbi:MAG: VOC family protein [Puniceicoccales bacterium]|jgi:glyoxylase I family protein|nr:VOC family protein [Puniceicoccales bacterium]